MANVPTSLNNLKTKVYNLNVGKLKTVLVDVEEVNNVVDNEVAKKSQSSTHWKEKLIG